MNTPEPNYSVRLTIHVHGEDPSAAVRAFAEHVLSLGLAQLTYNVREIATDKTYYADYAEYAPTDEVLKEIRRRSIGTWWIETDGWVGPSFGPYLDELDASMAMDEMGLTGERYRVADRPPLLENQVDQEAFEAPEPDEDEVGDEATDGARTKGEGRHFAVGTCVRCKTEGQLLDTATGLCAECEEDITGVLRG